MTKQPQTCYVELKQVMNMQDDIFRAISSYKKIWVQQVESVTRIQRQRNIF